MESTVARTATKSTSITISELSVLKIAAVGFLMLGLMMLAHVDAKGLNQTMVVADVLPAIAVVLTGTAMGAVSVFLRIKAKGVLEDDE